MSKRQRRKVALYGSLAAASSVPDSQFRKVVGRIKNNGHGGNGKSKPHRKRASQLKQLPELVH